MKFTRGIRQELENLETQLADKKSANAPEAEIAAAEAAYKKKREQFRPAPDELKKLEAALAAKKTDPAATLDEIKKLAAELTKRKRCRMFRTQSWRVVRRIFSQRARSRSPRAS